MFQFTSTGMCDPMGYLSWWKGATMRMIRLQNNQWSLKHCFVLCVQLPLGAQNVTTCPPPQTHIFLKRPFLTDFKKYIHTPPSDQKFTNPGKVPNPTVLAHNECPREIYGPPEIRDSERLGCRLTFRHCPGVAGSKTVSYCGSGSGSGPDPYYS